MLLDGHKSSFTYSIGHNPQHPGFGLNRISDWAWSSNVRHSVVVDSSHNTSVVAEWTNGLHEAKYREIRVSDAAELLSSFRNESLESNATAIARALEIFRNVRNAVGEWSGGPQDAVIAYGVVLSWAAFKQTSLGLTGDAASPARTLDDMLRLMKISNRAGFNRIGHSQQLLQMPFAEFADMLTEERDGRTLDVDLLIRHAGGVLFQDAHTELERRPPQRQLFLVPEAIPQKPSGALKRDAHFTPPSLARLLVQESLREFVRMNGVQHAVRFLDPACGSGAFLIEALRESRDTEIAARLTGYDLSPSACLMAEFSVANSIGDADDDSSNEILARDALDDDAWHGFDCVVMNPPFKSWRTMTTEERGTVRRTLGDLYTGHSDTSIAFIAKTIRQMSPGSVVATVVPVALLESEAGSLLRNAISTDPTLAVRMIGRFRGYSYFRQAAVEPAFLVIAKIENGNGDLPIKFVLADEGHEDDAIRACRRIRQEISSVGDGWEIAIRPASALSEASWSPRPSRCVVALQEFRDRDYTVVADLFETHLGIRTGNNPAFILSNEDYRALVTTRHQRKYFRPIADRIANAELQTDAHVFYPYGPSGELLLSAEASLRSELPHFYAEHLANLKDDLQNRKSLRGRKWWELSEPRPTWLAGHAPRIVSPTFAQRGRFAYDQRGQFAVVQGQAWIWRNQIRPLKGEHWFAYLALFNSSEFESLLECFCPRTQGGQYEVANRYVKNIPLPDLTAVDARYIKELASIGATLSSGLRIPSIHLDIWGALVSRLYGYSLEDFRQRFPASQTARLEISFGQLSRQWKRETGHISRMSRKTSHQAYQSIIEMGEAVLPLILRDLKESHCDWFVALSEITGENPISQEDAGTISAMTVAWLEWARNKKIDV